jgi:hypothetical protein
MSQRIQQDGLDGARGHYDDQYTSKTIYLFAPLQGAQDGVNPFFYIPQPRIVVRPNDTPANVPQLFQNDKALAFGTDYTVPDSNKGLFNINVGGTKPPQPGDSIKVTLNWLWMTDTELDLHLTRAANEVGFTTYYTNPPATGPTIPGTAAIPVNGSLPSDIPDGLFNAICMLAASYACKGIAQRYSLRYDTSAGDQSNSPSQMAQSFSKLADSLKKEALNARDDFYKSQGRQYRPETSVGAGFVLPPVTPPR